VQSFPTSSDKPDNKYNMKKWLPEELEEIPCDFCGTREVANQFIRKDGMRVVECAQCGLAYLNPRPKPEFIPKFYEADYFTGAAAERGEGGLKCNLGPTPIDQKTDSRVMEIINEKFGGFEGKDVLEIGCATGDLLIQIKDAGARVRGLEISDFASDIARKRGLDVSTGTIESFVKGNKEIFDIVLVLEVIEHVLSPKRFIEDVSKIVKPGGVLLLSTPNYASAKRFRNEWLGFNMSFEHIYFYSVDLLMEMMSKEGLTLEYSESSKHLGASQECGFLERQIERLRTIFFFIGEVGLLRTFSALFWRHKGNYSYALGHTIIMGFGKKYCSNCFES
jgi:SAM-dependent methyltransferase